MNYLAVNKYQISVVVSKYSVQKGQIDWYKCGLWILDAFKK